MAWETERPDFPVHLPETGNGHLGAKRHPLWQDYVEQMIEKLGMEIILADEIEARNEKIKLGR